MEENTLPLPDELIDQVGEYLDLPSANAFAQSCCRLHTLFKPELRAARLLRYIANNKQHEAENLIALRANPKLLLEKVKVKDTLIYHPFKEISPLQYTAYILNTPMLKLLMEKLSKEQKVIALQQLKALKIQGTVNFHNAFEELIAELKNYVAHSKTWVKDVRMSHWCQKVGGAQRRLPRYLVNMYSYPYFSSVSREVSLKEPIFRNLEDKNVHWLPLHEKEGLGFNFAIKHTFTREHESAFSPDRWAAESSSASTPAQACQMCDTEEAQLELSWVTELSNEKANELNKIIDQELKYLALPNSVP